MTASALGAGMAEQDLLDDDLRALDRVAEERGAAGLDTLRAAVERMRDDGDRDRLAWALPPLARAFALCEKFDEAEAAANEALAHFRVNGSVRGQAFALNALGVVALRRGVPSRALEVAGEAVVLARAAEDPILQVRIANTLGIVLNDIGRLSEAVQIFEEGLRAARGFPGEAVVLRLRSNLSLALGRWALKDHDDGVAEATWRPRAERAVELMVPTLQTWREEKKWVEISNALEHLAISHIVLGDLAAAHASLDEAESLEVPLIALPVSVEVEVAVRFPSGPRLTSRCQRSVAVLASPETGASLVLILLTKGRNRLWNQNWAKLGIFRGKSSASPQFQTL